MIIERYKESLKLFKINSIILDKNNLVSYSNVRI